MAGSITGNTCRAYVRQRKASTATARRELAVLSAALGHCEREGYLTRAPGVSLPSVPPCRHHIFSRRELASIILSARREPRCRDHLPLFVLLGAYTGKRSTAIRSLQWHPNTDGDGWVDVEATCRRGAIGVAATPAAASGSASGRPGASSSQKAPVGRGCSARRAGGIFRRGLCEGIRVHVCLAGFSHRTVPAVELPLDV